MTVDQAKAITAQLHTAAVALSEARHIAFSCSSSDELAAKLLKLEVALSKVKPVVSSPDTAQGVLSLAS